LCKQVVAHPASSTDSLTPTHYTTTRQSADLHHTARQASDEGQRRLAKRGVCAETGKNAGVPGTPQRHLGNSALAFRGRFISRACGSKALSHGVL
jgi:hypothetical protein